MKIEVNGKKYNVNPISYSDKLELRGWFWDVFFMVVRWFWDSLGMFLGCFGDDLGRIWE